MTLQTVPVNQRFKGHLHPSAGCWHLGVSGENSPVNAMLFLQSSAQKGY